MVTIKLEINSSENKISFETEADTETQASSKAIKFLQRFVPNKMLILNKLVDGQKIKAIKTIRQFYGLGLREAKELVEATEFGRSISFELLSDSQPYAFEGVFEAVGVADFNQVTQVKEKCI